MSSNANQKYNSVKVLVSKIKLPKDTLNLILYHYWNLLPNKKQILRPWIKQVKDLYIHHGHWSPACAHARLLLRFT